MYISWKAADVMLVRRFDFRADLVLTFTTKLLSHYFDFQTMRVWLCVGDVFLEYAAHAVSVFEFHRRWFIGHKWFSNQCLRAGVYACCERGKRCCWGSGPALPVSSWIWCLTGYLSRNRRWRISSHLRMFFLLLFGTLNATYRLRATLVLGTSSHHK